MTPYGICLFCDDIRFEQLNKLTLIGCYGPEMNIFTPLPVSIPKLGILVQIRFPPEPFLERKLIVYAPQNKEPFFTMDIGPKEEEQEYVPQATFSDAAYEEDKQPQRGVLLPIIFSPFVIEQEGILRVRMTSGSERIKLGGLRITYRPPDETPTA